MLVAYNLMNHDSKFNYLKLPTRVYEMNLFMSVKAPKLVLCKFSRSLFSDM